ncbi:Precorrin-4 C(11)-methyltransferase [Deinococcus saxicola]|uniref:precorrin-4 C(11)-methyltransferase n=1 Tax=Deinococcus saxicola TaxID=249406 RepID=UPI0039EEA446
MNHSEPKVVPKVYFIGAGPGAPDLITLRGARALGAADLVLYAGSLVPEAVLEHCRPQVQTINTAGLHLDEQRGWYVQAREHGWTVARLHSGDPAIYGATAEQMELLRGLEIGYEVIPGVSSFTACAAALGAELTRPEVSQTIIITRGSGRASAVPPREALGGLAAHGATMCIFLSGRQLESVVAELLAHYPPETPAALVQRVSQPQERSHRAPLAHLLDGLTLSEWALTTMILVGGALGEDLGVTSRLYDPEYAHRFRRADKEAEA